MRKSTGRAGIIKFLQCRERSVRELRLIVESSMTGISHVVPGAEIEDHRYVTPAQGRRRGR